MCIVLVHGWWMPPKEVIHQPWLALSKVAECWGPLARARYMHTMLHDVNVTTYHALSLWHTANSMNIFLSWILRNFLLMSFIKLERMVWHPSKAFGMQAWQPRWWLYVSQRHFFFAKVWKGLQIGSIRYSYWFLQSQMPNIWCADFTWDIWICLMVCWDLRHCVVEPDTTALAAIVDGTELLLESNGFCDCDSPFDISWCFEMDEER